ncbi:hypothetical protein C5C28_10150 [Rathayibacter rathayi]|nr:hypothetical protein C5C28_10150 [Rathayibacter rathayi]
MLISYSAACAALRHDAVVTTAVAGEVRADGVGVEDTADAAVPLLAPADGALVADDDHAVSL